MPKKPTCFDDIVGHKNLVEFLKDHLAKGTLPQFIILEGDEGLGKSSFAKILALEIMGSPQARQPLAADFQLARAAVRGAGTDEWTG